MDELICLYHVTLSTKLENPIFHVIENNYVNIDELNVILSISRHRKVNEVIQFMQGLNKEIWILT
jgi:hypothetical protein